MFRFLVLTVLLLSAGCSKNEKETPSQVLEIQVNNEKLTFIGEEFSGNENCGRLFVNLSSTTSKFNTKFVLSMDLTTEGRVKDILFVEYSDQNRHYRTADFVSSENFFIRNFNFDRSSRALSFDFTGTVHHVDYPQNTKALSGKVKINNFKEIGCTYKPWQIKANINQQPFNLVDISGMSNSEKGEWTAFSDNGIKISLITSQQLRDMPVGTYTFSKDDLLNKVIIEKYTGPYKATSFGYIPSEWESYQYEGELSITEQVKGTNPYTKGSFRFKAYKNNQVVYDVANGEFSI